MNNKAEFKNQNIYSDIEEEMNIDPKGNNNKIAEYFFSNNIKNSDNFLINDVHSKFSSPEKEKDENNKLPNLFFDNKSNKENEPETIILALKQLIKETNKEYSTLNKNYSKLVKDKNESQQLLQKCIEDVKFDINKCNKDIFNLSKNNKK